MFFSYLFSKLEIREFHNLKNLTALSLSQPLRRAKSKRARPKIQDQLPSITTA